MGVSKDWISEYLERRGSDLNYLFLSQYKQRSLNRGNAAVAIRELGQKAGLTKKVHPHLLRHTFGTYLIWAGVDPRTVQEMMGHDDLETTLKYYSAVTQERMKQAHSDLGNFIGHQEFAMRSRTTLAASFKVSRFVILRRLLTFGLITAKTYKGKAKEWENEKPPARKGGRSVPAKAAILTNGVSYSSLVFEAYKHEKLSYAAVSDYLGVKSKHLPEIEKNLRSYGR